MGHNINIFFHIKDLSPVVTSLFKTHKLNFIKNSIK